MNIDNEIALAYNKTIEILKGSNDDEKPFAVLSLSDIQEEDFPLLVSHLTNCDGRIRETVALKLVEIGFRGCDYSIIIDALCDVNPNVARLMVELIKTYNLDIYELVLNKIDGILKDIEEKSKPKKWKTQKNHLLNKKFFNLYWCLEGLSCCAKEDDRLVKILNTCAEFDDYTIREKVAKILVGMKNPPKELWEKLKNDENFYVKLCFEGVR